jgi:hypothetical protein
LPEGVSTLKSKDVSIMLDHHYLLSRRVDDA